MRTHPYVSLSGLLCLVFLHATNVQAEPSWSIVKTLSINHVGDPRNNDDFHAEAIGISYAFNDTHAVKLGYFENSQKRDSYLVGYTYTFSSGPNFDFTGNVYLANNYDDTYFGLIDSVELIPLLGINWHLTKDIDFVAEGIPVPGSDPYFLLQTGLSYRF